MSKRSIYSSGWFLAVKTAERGLKLDRLFFLLGFVCVSGGGFFLFLGKGGR
jgi:hypothetical protein